MVIVVPQTLLVASFIEVTYLACSSTSSTLKKEAT
jgi:hypothetical protein